LNFEVDERMIRVAGDPSTLAGRTRHLRPAANADVGALELVDAEMIGRAFEQSESARHLALPAQNQSNSQARPVSFALIEGDEPSSGLAP
jgi:hypothetical protein